MEAWQRIGTYAAGLALAAAGVAGDAALLARTDMIVAATGGERDTVTDGAMAVAEGASSAPSTTLRMTAENYVKMANGELNGAMAYMKGQLKVTGNVMLAQKMQAIFPQGK